MGYDPHALWKFSWNLLFSYNFCSEFGAYWWSRAKILILTFSAKAHVKQISLTLHFKIVRFHKVRPSTVFIGNYHTTFRLLQKTKVVSYENVPKYFIEGHIFW